MALIQMDFYSALLKRQVICNACIPVDRQRHPDGGRFCTMYLLHDYGKNCNSWLMEMNLQKLADAYGLALILPNDENHFYMDEVERMDCYSEYLCREVVEFTRNAFPLSAKREDTILAGIGMGGYGAVRNGLMYSGTFGSVIGISPLLTEERPIDLKQAARLKKRQELYIGCGENDRLVVSSRRFCEELNGSGIPYRYEEIPGTHESDCFFELLRRGIECVGLKKQEESINPYWYDGL